MTIESEQSRSSANSHLQQQHDLYADVMGVQGTFLHLAFRQSLRPLSHEWGRLLDPTVYLVSYADHALYSVQLKGALFKIYSFKKQKPLQRPFRQHYYLKVQIKIITTVGFGLHYIW